MSYIEITDSKAFTLCNTNENPILTLIKAKLGIKNKETLEH